MAIERLTIGDKTQNQGVNSAGKLTAEEFNQLVQRTNQVIDSCNSKVYLTSEEYEALVIAGTVQDNIEYNIYEE